MIPDDAIPVVIDTADDVVVVAGVADKKIRVITILMISSDAVVADWYSSGPTGTHLMGPLTLSQYTGHSGGLGVWMITETGDDLFLALSDEIQVGGALAYQLIDP